MTHRELGKSKFPTPFFIDMMDYNWYEGKQVGLFKDYTGAQKTGIVALFQEANKQQLTKAQMAYVLATAYHEGYDYDGKTTGVIQRLVPIKEKGGEKYLKSKSYYPYVGMGFVQLTHKSNYEKFQPLILKEFGEDILKDPNLLLRDDIAAFIAVYGMKHGSFTGKKLSDYINGAETDYLHARKIINGLDRASDIKSYSEKFLKCIDN